MDRYGLTILAFALCAFTSISVSAVERISLRDVPFCTWDGWTAANDEGYLWLQGMSLNSLEPLLNIDNFIDYMLINQYCGNNDRDSHNWYAFRRSGPESKGFQFLCWDSEQIFEGVGNNRFNLNKASYPTGIFQTLMKHPDFLHRYMDRAYAALSLGGQLPEEKVVETWDSLYHTIENALYLESHRDPPLLHPR